MKKRWISGGVAAALLIGGGVTAGVWWTHRGPDHPDQWDSRVTTLVEYVEKERGLEFEHPVYVDFLSEDDFKAQVTSDGSELTDDDREEIRQTEGLMRALGLIGPKVDLLDAVNDLTGGGVIGLYNFEDKRIRLRGTELTPEVKSTLVHELTHVLQDQHFDVASRAEYFKAHEGSPEEPAWTALLEGDANRIETSWKESLSAKQKKALDKAQAAQQEKANGDLKDVPAFLQASLGSSYVLGEAMLSLAIAVADGDDDNAAVDQLFTRPPSSEEHLYDPWTLLADDQSAVEVPKPSLAEGETEFDAGTFGAPSLAFLLSERIDPRVAMTATDGWGGDAYVAFERKGHSCMRVDFVEDKTKDVPELRAALKAWVAAGPAGTASVRPQGKGLRLTSCDPGDKATKGTGGSQDALQLAALRTSISTEVLGQSSEAFARCYSTALVTTLPVSVWAQEEEPSGLKDQAASIAAACK